MKNAKPIPFPHPSSSDDVGAALNLLRDALGEEEQRIRSEGAQAMHSGNYDTATAVIDFARRLLAFQSRVEDLEKEWEKLEELRDRATPEVQQIVSKRFFGRKPSGEITPYQDYCRPILEALVEMGGSGRTCDVIDRVGEKMKGILKAKDYEPHASEARQIRWRNTTQWARNYMVNADGRMKKGSRNGLWEISDAGRSWLNKTPK
jgi:restriction system protein